MILVLVLILLAAVMALALGAQAAARAALRAEERRTLHARLRAAAGEAAWDALRELAADTSPLVDHTNEAWAAPRTNMLPDAIETRAELLDATRDYNVNNLALAMTNPAVRTPTAVARDLLALARWPDPDGTVQALRDWADADAEGAREAGFHRLVGSGLAPPNAPFESPAELAAVLRAGRPAAPERDPAGWAVLPLEAGRLTPVNVNTAGREALLAVLGPGRAALVEALCRRRDARPVVALADVLDAETLRAAAPHLATGSRYFSVAARAALDGRQAAVRGLVRRNERGGIEVLRWVEP